MTNETALSAKENQAITPIPIAGSWLMPLIRGAIALVLGIAITFTTHLVSIFYALLLFGGYTLVIGLLALLLAGSYPTGAVRNSIFIQASAGIAAGVASFTWLANPTISSLLMIMILWAAITGFAELYLGISKRGKFAEARDWAFSGSVTSIFAIIILFIDPNYNLNYVITNKKAPNYEGVLTADIMSLGFFGAYCVIIGVFLLVGAFALRIPAKLPETQNV